MSDLKAQSKNLVLVGGGHAHALALLHLSRSLSSQTKITLVSESRYTAYSGMLTGAIAGVYSQDETLIDLVRLTQKAQVGFKGRIRFIEDKVVGFDPKTRQVLLENGSNPEGNQLFYDTLSFDTGAIPDLDKLNIGASAALVGIKPVARLQNQLEAFISQATSRATSGEVTPSKYSGKNSGPLRIVVVGAGAAGCEASLALIQRLKSLDVDAELHLVDCSDRVMNQAPSRFSELMKKTLDEASVKLLLNHRVREVSTTRVNFENGESLAYDLVIIATEPRPSEWVAHLPIKRTQEGFILIDAFLETSVKDVFAVGDVAMNPAQPIARAGVFAVRQASVLAHNLKVSLERPTSDAISHYKAFKPQKAWLSLMIDGQGGALGYRGQWVLGRSRALFALKNYIDRSFMQQFR